jgi:hypothetical protein
VNNVVVNNKLSPVNLLWQNASKKFGYAGEDEEDTAAGDTRIKFVISTQGFVGDQHQGLLYANFLALLKQCKVLEGFQLNLTSSSYIHMD